MEIEGMKHYEIVRDTNHLKRLANKMMDLDEWAYDTETNTLRVKGDNKDFKLVGISISWSSYHNYYIPVGHVFDEKQVPLHQVVEILKPVFERGDIRLIGHNLSFDMSVLARVGIDVKTTDLWDTMVARWLIDENDEVGLKACTQRDLGVDQTSFSNVMNTVTKEEKKSAGYKSNSKGSFDLVRVDVGSIYAVADSFFTWKLYLMYIQQLVDEGMLGHFDRVYKPFLLTLYNMEKRGVTVDVERLKQMGVDMQIDLDDLKYRIFETVGLEFNPNSSQQLAELIFGFDGYKNPNRDILDVAYGFPVDSVTPKGMPQANNSVLGRLAKKEYKNGKKKEGIEVIKMLLEHKKLEKLKTAFVDGLLEQMYDDGKVHPSFKIVGTSSGRVSCASPNLMQIPNAKDDDKYQIRDIFIGDMSEETGKRDKIIAVDYDNLEMKVLAIFSKDAHLVETFKNKMDSHGATAVIMFGLDCKPEEAKSKYPVERQIAKTINFLNNALHTA